MARILYRLSLPAPHTHLFEVQIQIQAAEGSTELVMPSWTPGSYLLREFPRNVQEFRAAAGTGDPLHSQKIDKNTWRVAAPEDGVLHVSYRVYANELTVRTSHLDASHGYVNGASVFMYVAGREHEPAELEISAPPDWRPTTALAEADRRLHFRARNYDELVDSPIEIGTHELIDFEVAGIPHRYAVWGHGNYDAARLAEDTRKIILACRDFFGDLPYDRYTFILHLIPGGRGGLEHRDSCSLHADPWSFHGKEYEQFLALVAHEFFHTWNGKRIRPAPLDPFDYTQENYTRSLWVVEGLTTYYTDLILRHAGIITPERYLERLGEAISRLQSVPGRHVQTLEESSFDTWIKFYRPDAHTPNSQVSYYLKGALVGLLLDLRIRVATENGRSLDDVMRALWERYGKADVGFPEAGEGGFEKIAEEICEEDLTTFFSAYLRDTVELDYGCYLEGAGVRISATTEVDASLRRTGSQRSASDLWRALGIQLKEASGRYVIAHVFAGSAAYDAGLNAGDEIVAIDDVRVTSKNFVDRFFAFEAGTSSQMTVLRRDNLLTLPFEWQKSKENAKYELVRVSYPSDLQQSIFGGWLAASGSTAESP